MGGEGNLATLRQALRDELVARGYPMPEKDPAWYAGVEEFTRLYHVAGFDGVKAELIPRPTPLPGGVADWVKTFRAGVMDVAMVPEWERDVVAAAVEARVAPKLKQADGSWCADCVRLRFSMVKPDA
jgi:hypothetical protein